MAGDEARRARVRLGRLAFELRVRRRRLNAFTSSPDWPGKGPTLHSEQVRYDSLLAVAAGMLELRPPARVPMDTAARAALEDALAVAGLDVFSPTAPTGDPYEDGDLVI